MINANVIQSDIYLALTSNTNLSALITGVFHSVKQNAHPGYPYIRLDAGRYFNYSSSSFDGRMGRMDLHVFDNQPSLKKVNDILSEVHNTLHRLKINTDDGVMVFDESQIVSEDENLTHATITFRIMTK